jgi:hypothetical protein
MYGEVCWNGRVLVTTKSFRQELYDRYRKNLDLVLLILEDGVHERESREKTRVVKKSKNGFWELVYTERNSCLILVHLKFRRY